MTLLPKQAPHNILHLTVSSPNFRKDIKIVAQTCNPKVSALNFFFTECFEGYYNRGIVIRNAAHIYEINLDLLVFQSVKNSKPSYEK